MRETLNVILNECEGSVPVVRESVRCHEDNRVFTLCHCFVSRLSHKAFLPPFRMTIGGKGVIMREMLIVIRSEREGSAAVVRKPVRRHPKCRRRICHRGEKAGKKIKAISCELSAISC